MNGNHYYKQIKYKHIFSAKCYLKHTIKLEKY